MERAKTIKEMTVLELVNMANESNTCLKTALSDTDALFWEQDRDVFLLELMLRKVDFTVDKNGYLSVKY